MASATKRGQDRWLGRYRDLTGRERTKMHPTKKEALAWGNEQERRIRRGEWTDPALSKITVSDLVDQYFSVLTVKPSTRAQCEHIVTAHVLPRWGAVRLDRIATTDVRAWLASLTGPSGRKVGPSWVRKTHGVFSQMLDLAVMDGRLPRNPARPTAGTKGFLPRLPKSGNHRYLSTEQLHALADECGDYRTFVLFLGYTGLRWGEATALRVRDVSLLQGRVTVARGVVEVNGELIYGTPKSHAARTVPVPAFLRDGLMLAAAGKGKDDLVFTTTTGAVLRNNNWTPRVLAPAAKRAGLGSVTPHVLRHTAASLAISAGANVKAVQKMLGHASASLTLDTYAGLFADDLDDIAERLNERALQARADSVRTETPVRTLPALDDLDREAV